MIHEKPDSTRILDHRPLSMQSNRNLVTALNIEQNNLDVSRDAIVLIAAEVTLKAIDVDGELKITMEKSFLL